MAEDDLRRRIADAVAEAGEGERGLVPPDRILSTVGITPIEAKLAPPVGSPASTDQRTSASPGDRLEVASAIRTSALRCHCKERTG